MEMNVTGKKEKKWENKKNANKIPVSNILEQFIGAEILDVNIGQLAAAAVDGVTAHRLQVVRHVEEIAKVAHVDGAPHHRVLADVAPCGTHALSGRQDLDRTQQRQYLGRHVPRKL